jgi:hypothetical protein
VPIIQGPRSCVLVKMSNQKVDLHRISAETESFRLLSRSARLQDLRTNQLRVLNHLEAHQLEKK